MDQTSALSVTTQFRSIGDITSLIFNPEDDCFYGCNATSNSLIKIEGISFFLFFPFCFFSFSVLRTILIYMNYRNKVGTIFEIRGHLGA